MIVYVRFYEKVNVSEENLDLWIAQAKKSYTKTDACYKQFLEDYKKVIIKDAKYIDKLKFVCKYLPNWDPNEHKPLMSGLTGKSQGSSYLQEVLPSTLGIPRMSVNTKKWNKSIIANNIQEAMDVFTAFDFYDGDYKLTRTAVENYFRDFFNSCESYYGVIAFR